MKVLKAALRQAASDIRPQLVGVGLFMVLGPVLFIVVMVRQASQEMIEQTATSSVVLAGLVGSFSTFVVMQIAAEFYSDRLGGALVRARMLPNGSWVWAIGKTFSCVGVVFIMQTLMLFAAFFILPNLVISWSRIIPMLVIALLSNIAAAPLGLVFGAFMRGAYSQLIGYAIVLALFVTNGSYFSIGDFPRWIQIPQLILPFYWSGHLSRWISDNPAQWEYGGEFTPVLAVGVLLTWIIVGFIVVIALLRYSFRKETFGSLANIQSKTRAQIGI
ncbi:MULTISPECIES: ABC transporter permease [Corynebacterium]|uniref:ABC transporter permease n=1 Tax=Corynebacterium TaxID=1716 RepID=UPI0008A32714|nr:MULTISPECIES: ABC transporter permease [Corynebacterium]MDK8825390.1 ABC transporter permease [Corynebacterium striatum]OFT52490.1 hypothetical protein HMPREF3153_05010 [Corynebacterium sp. HMSC06C06]